MVHQGERLAFLLEAGQQTRGIKPGLYNLQGNPPLDWFGLIRDPDFAHAAFAELLAKLVAPSEDLAGRQCPLQNRCRRLERPSQVVCRRQVAGILMGLQQGQKPLSCPSQKVLAFSEQRASVWVALGTEPKLCRYA